MKLKDIIFNIDSAVVGVSSRTGNILFDSLRNKRDYIQKYMYREIHSIQAGIRISEYGLNKRATSFIELHIEDPIKESEVKK
jgi:hypothetical protein